MYRDYNINEVVLPLDLAVVLPKDDLAFAVHHFVNSVPDDEFKPFFHQMGRPQYHPKMMLSIILAAYIQGVTSGRKIEDMLVDSIRMRWLSQNQQPDFRTINRFRVNPLLTGILEKCFIQFHDCLKKSGLISGEAIFIDGTKIEADANKYTFVWRKSIENYEAQMNEKSVAAYHQLIKDKVIPEVISEMKNEFTANELSLISEKLFFKKEEITKEINETESVPERKKLRKLRSPINKLAKDFRDFSDRKNRYEISKEIFGNRNSYSKTDHDATFLRMKDDPMKNGQLKAGYNIQAATEKQFVLSYQVFPNPTDTRTFIPFLKTIEKSIGLPEYIVADAGYGSEQNYQYVIDEIKKTPLISYNTLLKEEKRKYKLNPYNRDNWDYFEEEDYFLCPNNKKVSFTKPSQRKDKAGFIRNFKVYECEDCSNCPIRENCTKAKEGTNRKIYVNPNWENYKGSVKELLRTDPTKKIYKQRKIDVEPVFGDIKKNLGFTRFHVRGNEKIGIETGLICLAHNFRKILSKNRLGKKELKIAGLLNE